MFSNRPTNTGFSIAKYSADTLTVSDLTFNSTAITATGNIGTNTITVSSATSLILGMYIRLSNAVTGETFFITNIAGTTITLSANLAANYAATPVFFGCVSALNDLSGNQNNLVQATGASQPLLINNYFKGYKALYFDGIDDNLKCAFNLVQPYTLYVFVNADVGSSQFIFDGFTNQNIIRLDNTIPPTLQANAGNNVRGSVAGGQNIFSVKFNQNDSQVSNSLGTTLGNIGNTQAGGITLFGRFSNPEKALGYFLGLEIFPYAHNQYTIDKTLKNLQKQYGA